MSDERPDSQPAEVPPFDLARRVMAIDPEGAEETYRSHGQGVRDTMLSLLPEGWDFTGKRVLEFGCGAGRVMTAFHREAEVAEFWGCDIDRPSVEWIARGAGAAPFFSFLSPPPQPRPPAGACAA